MLGMIMKEFRQVRRDRRTLALMIVMPAVLLIVLGYAASFDVSSISAVVSGPQARTVAGALHKPFDVVGVAPGEGAAWAHSELRDGKAVTAFVTGAHPQVLVDGSQLFAARSALTALASLSHSGSAGTSASTPVATAAPQILFNPELKTSYIMIPGLAGLVLVFIGTIVTSLGVVRERETGTLEQLAVMPIRPRDVFLGKILPYFVVAAVDLGIVLAIGVSVFGVPFNGSVAEYALGALLFLFATLGTGVVISSVSQNQGQATQLALMTVLPQVLLSGLIFPLASIVVGVRWISYVFPLTYFTEISRGVMLRDESISALWLPFVCLAGIGCAMMALATLRFRAYLQPGEGHPRRRPGRRPPAPETATALAGAGERK
jgi:ABC-type multidrug transport system permease subunit